MDRSKKISKMNSRENVQLSNKLQKLTKEHKNKLVNLEAESNGLKQAVESYNAFRENTVPIGDILDAEFTLSKPANRQLQRRRSSVHGLATYSSGIRCNNDASSTFDGNVTTCMSSIKTNGWTGVSSESHGKLEPVTLSSSGDICKTRVLITVTDVDGVDVSPDSCTGYASCDSDKEEIKNDQNKEGLLSGRSPTRHILRRGSMPNIKVLPTNKKANSLLDEHIKGNSLNVKLENIERRKSAPSVDIHSVLQIERGRPRSHSQNSIIPLNQRRHSAISVDFSPAQLTRKSSFTSTMRISDNSKSTDVQAGQTYVSRRRSSTVNSFEKPTTEGTTGRTLQRRASFEERVKGQTLAEIRRDLRLTSPHSIKLVQGAMRTSSSLLARRRSFTVADSNKKETDLAKAFEELRNCRYLRTADQD